MRSFLRFAAFSLVATLAFAQPIPKENLQRVIGTNQVFGTNASTVFQTDTIATLQAVLVANIPANTVCKVMGYYTPGDGGGGNYAYSSGSSATANGGTVIAPNAGSGRWILQVIDNLVSVKQFGAYGDNSHDDTQAITNALGAGIPTVVAPGAVTYKITTPLSIPSNTTFSGSPGFPATINQTGTSQNGIVIQSTTGSVVQGLDISVGNAAGIYVDDSTGDCVQWNLRNIYVSSLGTSGVGIDIAGTSGAHNIGFARMDNVSVFGNRGSSYGTSIGIRFGVPAGAGELNQLTVTGGKVNNVNQGLDYRNCAGVRVYGILVYDCQGASGIGVHLESGAQQGEIWGIDWETGTYTKTFQADAGSADNFIYPAQGGTSTSLWTDAGIRNGWLGGDGSGSPAVANKIPNPINFTGKLNPSGGINTLTISAIGAGTTPIGSAPTDDTTTPAWNLGGTTNGSGAGGSTITQNFLFPFAGTYPQLYLATCAMVSSASSANYAIRTSIIVETVSGTFVEENLGYTHPGAATLTFSFSRTSNDVLFAAALTTNDGGTALTSRALTRLH